MSTETLQSGSNLKLPGRKLTTRLGFFYFMELTKRQMLERLQFSKNLQIAIKACQLISGELYEQDIKGMFLGAVLRNNFNEAFNRADDHNKAALLAKDYSVGRFMFTIPDQRGYITGEKYYLKISTKNGYIQVTPTVICEGDNLIYPNFNRFLENWKIS